MEQYINLGAFYDADAIRMKKPEIIALMKAYKAYYAKAYRFIAAAGEISAEITSALKTEELKQAVSRRAKGIISREIKKTAGEGEIKKRFLSAHTCQGGACLFETVERLCDNVVVLDNDLGFAGDMLRQVCDAATGFGHNVVLCPDPMNPDEPEHVIIPDLGLAFVTQKTGQKYHGRVSKHVRLDALADSALIRAEKARIKAGRKIYSQLIGEAHAALQMAKQLHDGLEAVYNPHVDFAGVYALADEHIRALLS